MSAFFAVILSFLAIFLILLVLVQRGRGGGLAGALGGMGGSSAFGAKAGDVFTRITIVAAAIWILFSLLAWYWATNRGDALGTGGPAPAAGRQVETTSPGTKPGETPGATTSTPPAEKTETPSSPAESKTTPAPEK